MNDDLENDFEPQLAVKKELQEEGHLTVDVFQNGKNRKLTRCMLCCQK